MIFDPVKRLTYVLENGYERTINLSAERFLKFIEWYHSNNSSNTFELREENGEDIVFFKDSILSVNY